MRSASELASGTSEEVGGSPDGNSLERNQRATNHFEEPTTNSRAPSTAHQAQEPHTQSPLDRVKSSERIPQKVAAPAIRNAREDSLLINGEKPPDHVTLLISRSKPRPESNSEESDFKIFIGKCLMELNSIWEVSLLLKALEFASFQHVVFDLDKVLVGTCRDEAEGYFWPEKGELVVAAGNMNSKREAFLGTFAHELAHWAITIVFGNEGLPYRRGSKDGVWYQTILKEVAKEVAKDPDKIHKRIQAVFDERIYKECRREVELIVVVPHLLAQFPNESHWGTKWTEELFEFYKISVLPQIQVFISQGPSKLPQRTTIAELNYEIGRRTLYHKHNHNIRFEFGYHDYPVLVIGCDHPTFTLFKVLRDFCNYQNGLCCNYTDILDISLGNKIVNCFNGLDECQVLVITSEPEDDKGKCYYRNLKSYINIVKDKPSKKLILIVSSSIFESTKNNLKSGSETFDVLKIEYIKENLTIDELTERSKKYLLDATVNFRGDYIALNKLVSLSEHQLIDGVLIENLLLERDVYIGNDCSEAISYDPDFILGDQLLDTDNVCRMICEKINRNVIFIEADTMDLSRTFPVPLLNKVSGVVGAENISSHFVATIEDLESSLQPFDVHQSVPIVLVQSQPRLSRTSFLRCLRQYYKYSVAYWIRVKPDKRIVCTGTHCPGLAFKRKLLGYNEDSQSPGIDAQRFVNTEVLPRDNEVRAIVLCDDAGTGKSWFLNALYGKLSDTHWVIKITLKLAKESIDALPISDLADEHVIKFIKFHENIDDDFAESFLKYKMRNDSKYRLLMIFDGMEEIPWTETCTLQQNREKISSLIKYLAEKTCIQTITATRPEDKVWLTNFPCRLYKFKGLGDCLVYIKTICGTRAELFGKSIGPDFDRTIWDYVEIAKCFLDTPLRINMLVEILTEDIRGPLRLHKQVNSVGTLYKEFVELQYRNYLKDKNIPCNLQRGMIKSLRDTFQQLAVFYLFSDKDVFKAFLEPSDLFEIKHGKLTLNTEDTSIYDIGLVTKHPSGDREVQFIHQTFPEYLASELFLSWIQYATHEQLLVKGVLCNPVHSLGMFDSMLKQQTITEERISTYARIMENGCTLDTLKAIGRSARLGYENMLELCAKCIRVSSALLKFIKSEYYINKVQDHSMYPYPLLPISEYCSDGVIITYLELGFDVNHAGPKRRVMMHNLVKRGKLELLQIIVKRWECKLDVEDREGISLIHEAACNGNLELIQWLHTQGLCLAKLCARGKSAVDYALEHDNWDAALWILSETSDNELQKNRKLLLHTVCDKGKEDILRDLLKTEPWKYGVNDEDSKGLIPLHLAIERGHLNIAKLLVNAGANLKARSKDGSSSLHFAARCGDPELIKWCLTASKDQDVNCLDHANRTPLHIAAEAGHVEAVKLFIGAGANMTIKSKGEVSLLHHAVMSGDPLMVDLVLKCAKDEEWFDVNCTTIDLKTPLLNATELGHLEIIKSLVNVDSDLKRKSKNGSSILHYSVISEVLEVVKWCLRNVPEDLIDSIDNEGKTPIHLAAELGLLSIVQELKEAGGDMTLLSYDDASVLHYAARSGKPSLMVWCLKSLSVVNFNVNHCDKENRTPLDIAMLKSDRRIMKILTGFGGFKSRSYQHTTESDERIVGSGATDAMANPNRAPQTPSSSISMVSHHVLETNKWESNRSDNSGTNKLSMEPDNLYCAVEQNNFSWVQRYVMASERDISHVLRFSPITASSPLHIAVKNKNAGIVQLIVAYSPVRDDLKAYFNWKDDNGQTPLHLAVEQGHYEIAHLLVVHGCSLPEKHLHFDLNIMDNNGRTPLQLSIEGGHQNIQTLLRQYGAIDTKFTLKSTNVGQIISDIMRFHSTRTPPN